VAKRVAAGLRWKEPRKQRNSPMKLAVRGAAIFAKMKIKKRTAKTGFMAATPL